MRGFGPTTPGGEFVEEKEQQLPPDMNDTSGGLAQTKANDMARTAVGEPPIMYDVRCVFDSRPSNAYDFNFFGAISGGTPAPAYAFTFTVPSGYRAVPREWSVQFQFSALSFGDIVAFLQANGADVPNNAVQVDAGTTRPIKSFFAVEENAQFGLRLENPSLVQLGSITVNVYGNLLPVTGVALPFETTNRKI